MRRATLLVMSLVSASCGVPDLVYVPDDAGDEVGVDARQDGAAADGVAADAGTEDATGDVGLAEASPDGSTLVDSGTVDTGAPDTSVPDTGAPDTGSTVCQGGVPPSGAILCCGSVPCVAPNTGKCQSMCATCVQMCTGGQTCCLHPNGSFNACAASPSACP